MGNKLTQIGSGSRQPWLTPQKAQLIQMRLPLLEKNDRYLVELYVHKGLSFHELSQLSGLDERTVARQVKRLSKRLLSDNYITIYRHQSNFTSTELTIAYDRFLLGLGYRLIAKRHKLPYRTAIKIVKKLQVWLDHKLNRKKTLPTKRQK